MAVDKAENTMETEDIEKAQGEVIDNETSETENTEQNTENDASENSPESGDEDSYLDEEDEIEKSENSEDNQDEEDGDSNTSENGKSDESDSEDGSDKNSGKSGFFKKKEKKDKKDEQIADLTDKLKRSMAEFENFRKRTDKEKSQMYEIGASDVISKILPVIDNFERGLGTITEEQKNDPIASGMELIYKQLMTALTDMGVTQIPALNEQFDPNLHNAVMHVEDENVGENVVVEEFQKGYKYRDGIVRHSMVKVAN